MLGTLIRQQILVRRKGPAKFSSFIIWNITEKLLKLIAKMNPTFEKLEPVDANFPTFASVQTID